ncbi:hypothetical protein MHUMG1_03199 [Metarhizium humberi]|uniref:Uncharacterized protein n=1 Tax=Metarhizium humberi TaxID=2596975 RepID=A0A9P8S8Y2_9HYPO|nr:hypothetical protein MHUMG1_03199 [Metarhizium humberi]
MVPLVGFKDDIVISHFVSNLRIGFEQNPVSTSDAPTMRAAIESFGKRTSAYESGLIVAETYFSQIHKVAHMQSHAAALYSHALGRLRLDLQYINNDFDRARAFLGLWTAYFLSLYELISSSTSGLWLQHAQGVATLIEMLGPDSFQTASANALLEVKRPFLVNKLLEPGGISHIVMRKRCFLEAEKWKTGPWAPQPDSKLPGSMLMDVFVTLPGIVEDADKLKADSEKMRTGTLAGAAVMASRTKLQGRVLSAITTYQNLAGNGKMYTREFAGKLASTWQQHCV